MAVGSREMRTAPVTITGQSPPTTAVDVGAEDPCRLQLAFAITNTHGATQLAVFNLALAFAAVPAARRRGAGGHAGCRMSSQGSRSSWLAANASSRTSLHARPVRETGSSMTPPPRRLRRRQPSLDALRVAATGTGCPAPRRHPLSGRRGRAGWRWGAAAPQSNDATE